MKVLQGHSYVGGASSPPIVPNSQLASGLAEMGFDHVTVIDRADFPKFMLPPIPPGSDPDWDIVGSAHRVAADGEVALPSRVRWVVDVTPAPPAQPASGPMPTGGASGPLPPVPIGPPVQPSYAFTPPSSGVGVPFVAAAILGGITGIVVLAAWHLPGRGT